MDQVMADVTEIPEAEAGDQAILLGKATETGEEITVEELSEKSGRFPYEFFSLLTARVPRIYTDGE